MLQMLLGSKRKFELGELNPAGVGPHLDSRKRVVNDGHKHGEQNKDHDDDVRVEEQPCHACVGLGELLDDKKRPHQGVQNGRITDAARSRAVGGGSKKGARSVPGILTK